jgi:hypothetical protein
VDIGGGEHGLLAALDVPFVETAREAALASLQLSAYLNDHSKSLVWRGEEKVRYLSNPAKSWGISRFLFYSGSIAIGVRLIKA